MKKSGFVILWFCFPFFPSFLYMSSAGSPWGVYPLSIALGVYSYTLLAGQLFLISRPVWLQRILSVKEILTLHSAVPLIVLALSLVHRFLKESAGFSLETAQAIIGLASWFFLLLVIVAALLLLANTFITKNKFMKNIKDLVYSAFKLSYSKVRASHNMTVLLAAVLCVHVFLSSLSDVSFNPAGTFVLFAWTLFCFVSYIVYRIRGRK